MAKLYFKYGVMGSSKTAQAIITKFNYEEGGNVTELLKPATDTRDGHEVVKSRIDGLIDRATVVPPEMDIFDYITKKYKDEKPAAIIVDESQFLTPEQVDQLHMLALNENITVICFGLKTDFRTHFFPGSRRLMEIAESLAEVKMVCACGAKAEVNARLDGNGNVTTEGEQVFLGGNESYKAMCFRCYLKNKTATKNQK